MTEIDPRAIAERLGLVPLGFEGGWYKETYRSELRVEGTDLDPRYTPGERRMGTGIFYMLTPETRSLMHRLRTDEIYHFYLGDPVDLLLVDPDGAHRVVRLGPDLFGGEEVQQVVPAGTWQGSQLVEGGRFALMGTTMAPGFELADFELGRRSELVRAFPHLEERLRPLTPDVLETPRLEIAAATRDLLHAELRGIDALLAGVAAQEAPDWASLGIDPAQVRSDLARLETRPGERRWVGGYVIERERRHLVGRYRYDGPPDSGGVVELEGGLVSSARGRGFGTEAARALIADLVADPSVRMVRVRASGIDPVGRRTLERVGLRPEGGSPDGAAIWVAPVADPGDA